jgi:NADH-quinone oxidoreductase subunit F
MPVRAMIKHFRPEFEALIRNAASQGSAAAGA